MYQVLKLLVMSNRESSHFSHMTSVDFSPLNANWTPALPSRLSIFRFKNNALSAFDQPWNFGFFNIRKPKVWLQQILSFPWPAFFNCYCFWLRSTERWNPSLIPPTNPLASDNANHKNPVEPITSPPDAVCLANQALTLSTGRYCRLRHTLFTPTGYLWFALDDVELSN